MNPQQDLFAPPAHGVQAPAALALVPPEPMDAPDIQRETPAEYWPDYELLAVLLGGDKPRSKALLATFGTLPAVMAAPAVALEREGLTPARVRLFLAAREANLRCARGEFAKRPVIASWSALLSYVRLALAHEAREQFRVIYLDRKNQLIADEICNHGTVDHAPVYPREVMRRSLELSASAIILVHNHPSGDPTPSSADIDMTKQVVEAGRPLRIAVHDHLVVGREGVASFKALGLF